MLMPLIPRALLTLAVLTAALAIAGCGDKTAAAGTSDPSLTSARLDGGMPDGSGGGRGAGC